MSEKKHYTEKEFFAIHSEGDLKSAIPSTPSISLQFRTDVSLALTNINAWTDVSITSGNRNNYFADCKISDSGGAQMVNISLFDKDSTFLENTVIQSILAVKLKNDLANENISPESTEAFSFSAGDANIHLRLKFGYSDLSIRNEPAYRNRADDLNRSVLKSRWLYLQILNANFKILEGGLKIEIKCISVSNTFLTKAKILKKNAMIQGTPRNIIGRIGGLLNQASKGNLIIIGDAEGKVIGPSSSESDDIDSLMNAQDEPGATTTTGYLKSIFPDSYMEKDDTGADVEKNINIILGTEARTKMNADGEMEIIQEYMNIRDVLNQITKEVPPRHVLEDGRVVSQAEIDNLKTEGYGADVSKKTLPFSWMLVEDDIGDAVVGKIVFYYQDQQTSFKNQDNVRSYSWSNFSDSIIRSLDVNTDITYAQMNMQLAVKTANGELRVITASGADSDSASDNFEIKNATDVTDATNFENSPVLVSDYADADDLLTDVSASAKRIANNLITSINQGVYKATLEIPGDPFWLFDKAIQPYQYFIFINVRRPVSADDASLTSSFISGYYVVGKIEHDINNSDFTTRLELMKFPVET